LRLKRTVTCGGVLVGGEIQHARRLTRISLTELIGRSGWALCADVFIDVMPAAITIAMGLFEAITGYSSEADL
jgi:hypothetical protein